MRGAVLVLLLLLPSASAAPAWIWSGGEADAVTDTLSTLGLGYHEYTALDMVSFRGDPAIARYLVSVHGGRIDPAETYDLHLDESVPLIEADRVKAALGAQRDGPTVLVIDTGADSLHPDLQAGNLAANIAAERVDGLVVGAFLADTVIDESGHGTHVTGIVVGSGTALGAVDPLNGRYQGVYSNGRAASFQASTATEEAQVDSLAALEAFDWALQNQDTYDVRVVTNSWGIPGDLDPDHPVNEATKRLYLAGITVIFSAGNLGGDAPEGQQLNKFCQAPWVLCVAAGGPDRSMMGFSSRGTPGKDAPPYAHPDITAPGWLITAPNSITDTDALSKVPKLLSSSGPSTSLYIERAGTSMAAPHVAGAAALLLAANPDLSPDQVMDILTETATEMPEPLYEAGVGYLSVREAYNLAVQTEGNQDAFLAGDEVKYAGADSGDPYNADDATSIGYTGVPSGGAKLLAAGKDAWVGTAITFWVLVGLGVVSTVLGVRFRRGS